VLRSLRTSPGSLGATLSWLRRLRRRLLAHRRLGAAILAVAAVALTVHAVRPPAPASVALTVAGRDLPAGTVLAAGDLARVRVPPGAVPAGFIERPTGRVLAAALRRGEPITDARLVGPDLTAGHPELVAVPVRLPDAAMASLLRVGDRVELLATDPQDGGTTVAAPDALVLALPAAGETPVTPQNPPNAVTSGSGGRLVVIGVTENLVTRVAAAAVRDFLTYAYGH
jgi:Flp pilus assembly protein CpaB